MACQLLTSHQKPQVHSVALCFSSAQATVDKSSVDPAQKQVQTRQARYVTFHIPPPASPTAPLLISHDSTGDRSTTYRDFARSLNDQHPRFCCYDFEYVSADGRPTSALYCIYWMPQQVNQQERILYSSGKSNFVSHLSGYKHFTAEDKDEVKEILEKEVIIKKAE